MIDTKINNYIQRTSVARNDANSCVISIVFHSSASRSTAQDQADHKAVKTNLEDSSNTWIVKVNIQANQNLKDV